MPPLGGRGGRVVFPPPGLHSLSVHVAALVALRQEGDSPIIFLVGALRNKDRKDGKPLGAASAVLHFAWKK